MYLFHAFISSADCEYTVRYLEEKGVVQCDKKFSFCPFQLDVPLTLLFFFPSRSITRTKKSGLDW